jgi:hypothetical protein
MSKYPTGYMHQIIACVNNSLGRPAARQRAPDGRRHLQEGDLGQVGRLLLHLRRKSRLLRHGHRCLGWTLKLALATNLLLKSLF